MSEFWGDLPWVIGLVGAIIYFGIFEWLGFVKPGKFNTLSHAVYTVGAHWAFAIFLMGGFCFGLATHFFWHYCPPGSINSGSIDLLAKFASLN